MAEKEEAADMEGRRGKLKAMWGLQRGLRGTTDRPALGRRTREHRNRAGIEAQPKVEGDRSRTLGMVVDYVIEIPARGKD